MPCCCCFYLSSRYIQTDRDARVPVDGNSPHHHVYMILYGHGVTPSVFRCASLEWNAVPKCNGMQVSQLYHAMWNEVPNCNGMQVSQLCELILVPRKTHTFVNLFLYDMKIAMRVFRTLVQLEHRT